VYHVDLRFPFTGESLDDLQRQIPRAWGEAYRDVCIELYRQDLSERISALLERLDAQNDFLDAGIGEENVSRHILDRVPPTSPLAARQHAKAM
jgi:hypothetical protein